MGKVGPGKKEGDNTPRLPPQIDGLEGRGMSRAAEEVSSILTQM